MSKVAIISDTHWGVRNDNVAFMDMTKRFLDDVFFPKLKSERISTIIHLGDLVDRRKQISYLTANRLRRDFLQRITYNGIDAHFLVGNHDTYYKNTNDVNALTELVEGNYCELIGGVFHDNIRVYTGPEEVDIEGKKILFLPWICADNREESLKLINESNAKICMGHLEIQGFEMFRGSVSTHGENRRIFDRFDLTLSGHYHHRSSDGSITYVGSHGEFTWSDYEDDRGFHILDLETQELTFVQNPYKMFTKVWYDDTNTTLEKLLEYDFGIHKDTMVKIVVKNKTNPYWFDVFCNNVEQSKPLNVQIVEDHLNLNLEDDEDIVNEAESTLDIFMKHIGQINTQNVNKSKLERLVTDLYNRALVME